MHYHDISGLRFGKWTVIKIDKVKTQEAKERGSSDIYWICKCDCGTIKSVCGRSLKTGASKSCGCYNIESHKKSNKIYMNTNNKYGIAFFNSNDGKGFLFDEEDLDIVRGNSWHDDGAGYPITTIMDGDGKQHNKRFHRAVMEKLYGEDINDKDIDHINHNTYDSRKYMNLRLCTTEENSKNSRYGHNPKSGYRYIRYNEQDNTYTFVLDGIRIEKFDNADDARLYVKKYFDEHPDEFRYNPDNDLYKIATLHNAMIIDLNINKAIISPFTIIDYDKFNGENNG